MAAINYDAQGFILGLGRIESQTQSVHEDTQEIIRILRGQLEQMREANTRARRNQNQRTSTIGDRNSSRSHRDSLASRGGNADNNANRTDSSSDSRITRRVDDAGARNPPVPNQRDQNSANRQERLRDERGRFIRANSDTDTDTSRQRQERRERRRDANGRFTRENDGAFKKLLDALKLDADTNNLDPFLDSLKELQGMFAPVFKMAKGIWKAGAWTTSKLFARARRTPLPNEQRHQNRFIRRTLAAILRSIRARNGGSLLSSLLGGRRISRLLGAGGILGGVLGLLRGGLMGGLRGGAGLLRALGKRTPLLGALLGGVGLAANWDKLKGDDRAAGVGGLTGGTLGAIAGGALGSLAGPIGTAVGAAAGGWLGEKGGQWLGKNLAPTIKEWGQSLKRADLPNKLLSFTKFAINPIFGGLSLFSDSLNNWAKNITSFDFRGKLSKLLDGLKNALGSMFDGGGDGQSLWDRAKAFGSSIAEGAANLFGGGGGNEAQPVPMSGETKTFNTRNGPMQMQQIVTKGGQKAWVDAKYAPQFQGFINDLEASGYEIKSLGGFADRQNRNAANKASHHAFGHAIDLNPSANPNRSSRTDLPVALTQQLIKKWGLGWGYNWKSVKDPMHFSVAENEGGRYLGLDKVNTPQAHLPKSAISAQQTARAQQAVQYFMSQGWTREQAIGIAANLQKESGFNNIVTGDDGKAYGIAQWHADRQANFQRVFGKSIKTSTFNEQLAFVHHELTRGTEQGAGKRLRGARNAGEAAAVVSQYYERPLAVQKEKIERAQIANQLKAQLGNVAPAVMPNTVAARQDSTQNIFNAANQAKLQSTGSIATPTNRDSTQAIFNAAHPVNNQVQNKSSIGTISPSAYARPNIITRANMAQGKKSASPQIKTPKTPSIVMPKVSEKLNTGNNQKTVLSVLNQQQMPQNVSDRGIAHAVTGGLGEHRFWQ